MTAALEALEASEGGSAGGPCSARPRPAPRRPPAPPDPQSA